MTSDKGQMTKSAIILGSGIWRMLRGKRAPRLSGGEVRQTPFGPSRPVFRATLPGGRRALLLTRHGERAYDTGAWAVNYRANLWALKDLGADHILATCACGGIDPRLAVGTFVVPHDILDKTTGRAKTYFESSGVGILRHSDPFCPALRSALADGLASARVRHRLGGVYVCTDGPRLETPAEVRAYAAEGATLVGMTLAPEFALARELQMCYAAVAFVVNPAEGVAPRPYRPDVLFEGMATDEELDAGDRAAERLPAILAAALEAVSPRRRCHCRQAMRRYIERGEIGEDFRTWVKPPGGRS
ncbi:MAG: MTAP family purine nucleoside phosphorylase [Planctomycetes bacterium]|nr:MTAP family purine nucleoside phosphorylase [Planctomycetota bacterium]